MKTVLWVSLIWLPVLIALIQINEAKFKKNIVVGVTLPKEGKTDAGVIQILDIFRKQTVGAAVLCILLGFAGWMIETPYLTTVFMTWVLAAVIFPMIPFIHANLKLKDYKREKGWTQTENTVYVDTAALEQTRLLSPWLFVPPVVICLIPLIWDRDLFLLDVIFAIMCASFWFGYRYLYRSRAEMFNENTDITNALSRMRRYNWGKIWLLLSYGMSLTALAAALPAKYQLTGMIGAMVLMTALVAYSLVLELRTRRVQEKLTAQAGSDFYVDEDDHWPLGMFYYNPDDTKLIINNRTGLNTTVNIARPAGKILMGLAALLIAALPFMGLFLDSLGTKPIELTVNDTQLVSRTGMYHYEITLDEIENTELLENLPSSLSRRAGTGLDHLLEGSFTSEEYPALKVLLDPGVSPFILVETKDGKYWLFNTRDSSETMKIFDELNQ